MQKPMTSATPRAVRRSPIPLSPRRTIFLLFSTPARPSSVCRTRQCRQGFLLHEGVQISWNCGAGRCLALIFCCCKSRRSLKDKASKSCHGAPLLTIRWARRTTPTLPSSRTRGIGSATAISGVLLLCTFLTVAAVKGRAPWRSRLRQCVSRSIKVEPYGGQASEGAFVGASVDLWRRVAHEHLDWPYRLMPVSQMSDVMAGLEDGTYDVAIGAITITPERLARVDFSFPTHRSGVAAVFAHRSGALCLRSTTMAKRLANWAF